ncbi:TPA: hypothetical protein SAO08_002497 [Burkholderia multivorans]|uniref:hypothetical protein n=1 Tax=Burkholderia multivorans TaxID=87883 RepID=UPI00158D3005|nr:hypothetical protein [Burkholderia multivorans]HEF4742665.1 hypothetical protein [Burkholderia multivorans]
MLGLPESGISASAKKHNSNLGIVCDWIESSVVFTDDSLSKADIVDVLLENEIYQAQDFALEFIDSVWSVLRARVNALNAGGALQLRLTPDRIERRGEWRDFPAYAFCLALSCGSYVYPRWARDYGYDSSVQGSLFERVAHHSLLNMLPGWRIQRVGWAPDNPVRLYEIIDDIVSSLNEVAGSEIDVYVDSHANELGLDLLAAYSFGDENASSPLLMIQCASGKDWQRKRHTPDLTVWNKIINFNSPPVKGFVIPYSFTDKQEFRKEATKVNGVFLDRYRLLNPNRAAAHVWDVPDLNADLVEWVGPRIEALPPLDA